MHYHYREIRKTVTNFRRRMKESHKNKDEFDGMKTERHIVTKNTKQRNIFGKELGDE